MGTIYDLRSYIPEIKELQVEDILDCPYSGENKTIKLPAGTYKLMCWGAQGGSYDTTYYGGKGGYSEGIIKIDKPTTFYLYAGGQGANGTTSGTFSGGFNGGGQAYTSSATYDMSAGGGASDIRVGTDSLYARVIVAGGGGGAGTYSSSYRYSGGPGGGTSGTAGGQYSTSYRGGGAGTATSAGISYSGTTSNNTTYFTAAGFGTGGAAKSSSYCSGGGGGWYGGGGAARAAGGGGSGYIYTSSTASQYPSGCLLNSSYYLTDTSIISGSSTFIAPLGGDEIGHSGDGYVRIFIQDLEPSINNMFIKKDSITWISLFDGQIITISKIYIWEKYSIEEIGSYNYTTRTRESYIPTSSYSWYVSTSFTFNDKTGIFSLDNPTRVLTSQLDSYSNYYAILGSTSGTEMEKILSVTLNSNGTGYDCNSINYQSSGSISQQKGDFIEEVSSLDLNAYPENGVLDDYWYVYKGYETAPTYVWNTYSVKESVKYISKLSGENISINSPFAKNFGTSYTFNEDTGEYSLINPVRVDPENFSQYIGYYFIENATVWYLESVNGTSLYGKYWIPEENITITKGEKIGTIESTDRNSYPDNNYIDSTWYEYSHFYT